MRYTVTQGPQVLACVLIDASVDDPELAADILVLVKRRAARAAQAERGEHGVRGAAPRPTVGLRVIR